MAITWMCEHGQHGTPERRSLTTVDCECECHLPIEVVETMTSERQAGRYKGQGAMKRRRLQRLNHRATQAYLWFGQIWPLAILDTMLPCTCGDCFGRPDHKGSEWHYGA